MQLSYPAFVNLIDRNRASLVRAAATILCVATCCQIHAAPPAKLPSFEVVAANVQAYFAAQPDHRSGDLIHRSQAEAVLNNVAASGWKLDDAKQILERTLPEGSFLIRELAKPSGKKFMRKVGAHPGGYSHLDRLSTIPRGERIVRDLIRQPNGDDLITYLATTEGGHNLGKMMNGVRKGVDLNKPTGRIYTEFDLLAELKNLHDEATR